jgi:nitrite reductase (NAD(P)H)
MLKRTQKITEIRHDGEGRVCGVVLADDVFLECELVCFAIGIKARDELAKGAAIECHPRVADSFIKTSHDDIFAVCECACFEDATYGLIAPGIEMAKVLDSNMTSSESSEVSKFKTRDLSTKLKLLGVDVASFGDYFAERDGPSRIPSFSGQVVAN